VKNEPNPKPNFLQMVGSVLAAFLGVQSDRNRERDFTKGRAVAFIVVGVGMTILFVVCVWLVVQTVIGAAG